MPDQAGHDEIGKALERRPASVVLELREVQPPGFAFVVGGELLEAAAGVLALRLERGGAALFGLLVEETNLVHAPPKPEGRQGSPFGAGLRGKPAPPPVRDIGGTALAVARFRPQLRL